MKKIAVPQEIHKAYSQILFDENIELNMANQMLKILEYGCVILSNSDLHIEILRKLKELLQRENTINEALYKFNTFHNDIKTNYDFITKYYYIEDCPDIETSFLNFKTLKIHLMESVSKNDEILDMEKVSPRVLKYNQNSLIGKTKFTNMFIRYFRKIEPDFPKIISLEELETIRILLNEYLVVKCTGTTSSRGYIHSKINRLWFDLKDKKMLQSWEIVFLNELLYRFRHKNNDVYKIKR